MTDTLQARLFDAGDTAAAERTPEAAPRYVPISSVWEGSDGELPDQMLTFYPSIPPEPILDAAFNRGRFRKGPTRRVVSMDINPKFNPMIVGDNRKTGRQSEDGRCRGRLFRGCRP